jgi:hypothetical protein
LPQLRSKHILREIEEWEKEAKSQISQGVAKAKEHAVALNKLIGVSIKCFEYE